MYGVYFFLFINHDRDKNGLHNCFLMLQILKKTKKNPEEEGGVRKIKVFK